MHEENSWSAAPPGPSRVFHDLVIPALLIDADGRILEINDAAMRRYGWAPVPYAAWRVDAIIEPASRKLVRECREACLRGDLIRHVPVAVVSDQRAVCPARLSLSLLTGDEGRPEGIAVLVDEIPAVEAVPHEADDNAERLRLAAEAASFGMYDLDLRTGRTFWSPELKEMMGLPPDQKVPARPGQPPEFIHPDDKAIVTATLCASFDPKGDGEFESEHRIRRFDGEWRWVFVKGRTTFEGTGSKRMPARAVGVVVDITGRKQVEEARQKVERRRQEVLATLSHELSSTLAALDAAADLLQRGVDDESRIRELVEAEIGQLKVLISDLVEATRVTHGKVRLQRTGMDLVSRVRRLVESVRPMADEKQHRIVLEMPEALSIEADATRVDQIVMNLLVNAIKYTPGGGRIAVAVEREAERAVVRVTDTGRGMTSEVLSSVFEPFFQARPTDNGLGLGLPLARGLAELHGGTLIAESPGPKQGSTFVLRLPIRAPRSR